MKTNHFLVLILGFVAFCFSCATETEKEVLPLPKDPGFSTYQIDESSEKHRERLQYLERIHKSNPNIDWRKIELLNSKNKYNKHSISSNKRSGAYTSFLNGQLEAKWLEKGSSNQAGRTMVSTYDAQTQEIFLVSASGTVYKGTKEGKNWMPLNDQIQMTGANYIGIEYDNGQRIIWVSSSKYVYYSQDEGLTWNTASGLETVVNWGSVQRLVRANNHSKNFVAITQEWDYTNWNATVGVYLADTTDTVFHRIARRSLSTNLIDVWAPMEVDSNVYVLLNQELYTVDFAHDSLQQIGSTPFGASRVLLAGGANANKHALYVYADQDIYYSSDTGSTWLQRGSVPQNPFRRTSFYALNSAPDTLLFGGVNAYLSTNAGTSFQVINSWGEYYGNPEFKLHADIPSILSIRDETGNEVIHFNTDGGMYESLDGSTVQNLSLHGLNVSQYYSVYTYEFDTNIIYAGSQDQGFQQSEVDSGNSIAFDQLISGDYAHIVSSNHGYSIWHEYPGFIVFKESPQEDPWTSTANFDGRNDLWLPPLAAYTNNANRCYMGGKSNAGSCLFRVENLPSGIVYHEMPFYFSQNGGGTVTAVENSTVDENLLYVNTDGKFFISHDRGVTYTSSQLISPPDGHYFHGSTIYASKHDVSVVYIGGSGYSNPGVFVSSDTGKTFTEITNGLPNTLVFHLEGDAEDSIIYAATESGPYAFSFKDSVWYDISNNSAPDQAYWSVDWVNTLNTVRFGTYGRGIWDFKIKRDSLPNDSVGDTNLVVLNVSASSNAIEVWPNPTKSILNVNAINVDVQSIELYSLHGQIVKKSRFSEFPLNVSHLNNGVYVLVFETNKGRVIKKFTKTN